jgi:hypothetical protein
MRIRLAVALRVFTIPAALQKILDQDLKAAGLPKRDARRRTLDVHALRTIFGTLLSAKGWPPDRLAGDAA